LLVAKGVDVANMAFVTMMEIMSCKLFNLDSSACEEILSGGQGVKNRWGIM